jgi:hypothetical protein
MRAGDGYLFPNLWIVLLAPSSLYRKSTALSIGARLINDARPGLALPSEWSHESLIAQMQEQSHGYMTCYEFKTLMGLLSKDYNAGAQALLTELYDCPSSYSRKLGTKKIVEYRIERPCLTIGGASTMDWLIESVQGKDVAGGFLARFLFVSADHKEKVIAFQDPADMKERELLVHAAKSAAAISGEMKYTADARRFYEEWFARFTAPRNVDSAPAIVRPFVVRLTSYAHKLAMIESAQNGHKMTITLDDCRRGCMMADNFAAEVRRLAAEDLGASNMDRLKNRILKHIKKRAGEMPHSVLLRNIGGGAKPFNDAIDTLKQSGQIEERKGEHGKAYSLIEMVSE